MVFEQIEKLKRDYTDKYVKVDADRPELARFKDVVGQVKTVNMSGRALVEFCDYFDNIGWYDIDLNYLQVVDKPAPKHEEAKPARKAAAPPAAKAAPAAAGEKKLSPLEMARMQGAAKKAPAGEAPPPAPAQKTAAPAAGKKLSVAEMMAAARAEKKPAAEKAPAAAEEAAPAPPAEAAPAKPAGEKVDRSKMSVAEMIAMAKARDSKK